MTLRKRLFLQVGVIFLLVCILSYFVPSYLINQHLAKAGGEIKTLVQAQEDRVYQMFSQVIAFNFRAVQGIEDRSGLNNLLQEIARVAEKDIVFLYRNKVPYAFDKDGKPFDVSLEGFDVGALKGETGHFVWKGAAYNYIKYPVDSGWESSLFIVGRADQEFSVVPILTALGNTLAKEISANILAASLLIFAAALLVLSRTSKKITAPIVQLVQAAGEIEQGNYEKAALPDLGARRDEIAALSRSFEKMIAALKDREKIRGVLSKVVSKEIAAEILKSKIELGGEERQATVLFSDIRGFTKMSEAMEPKKVIAAMNGYFTEMCRIIDANGGVVDKFVGDEIMALYGAPIADPGGAKKAVAAALLMRQQSPYPIGIGIHTGNMVAGNVGSENRLNYTVLGANVNLAARLCSAAKPMQILVSEAMADAPGIRDSFQISELPPIPLKGFEHPVKVYEISDFKE